MLKIKNIKNGYQKKISKKLKKEYQNLGLEKHEIEIDFCEEFEKDKQYPEWYHGDLIVVNIDNRYTSYFIAGGMISGVIGNAQNETNFKREHSSIEDLLNDYNIKNDKALNKASENGQDGNYEKTFLKLECSNWFEVSIYDKKENKWYEGDSDGVAFKIDEFSLEYALWYIPEFYKFFNSEEEQN